LSRRAYTLEEEKSMVDLRKLRTGDLDAVHALISRMDIVRYMRLPICSREESEKFLRDSLQESSSEPWRSIVRAISDSAAGDLIGLCGLVILKGAHEGEIWYLISPEWWGKGKATEAAQKLLDLGFGELGLHRIWATCLPENPASSRVLEKAGMRKEGFLVKNLEIHGEWKSSFLYAMLGEEWTESHRS
jgi:RimJ/RimL family protein N-acetyltransferase